MKVEDIRRIAIVGAGLMGHGIAQEFALAGYEVRVHDLSEEKLQQAIENIRASLQRLRETGLVGQVRDERVLGSIYPSIVLKDVVADADVVVECVFENLELKREVFQELDNLCPERTILASNTSTLLPSKLASATRRPDRVLVTHYYNPSYLLPLVEVVRGEETSDETVMTMHALLTKVGKRPVIVEKEVPGFIGNRLQGALVQEALSIVQKGIASPQDVDIVIKNSFGRRLAVAGVFEVFDLAGWDLVLAASQYVAPDTERSTDALSLLREKVKQGELGVKTGKGFYEWTPESAEALRRRIAQGLVMLAQLSKEVRQS